jgi:fatty acid desaturase
MDVGAVCLTLGLILFLSYLFFVGQIVIHNCVHGSLFHRRTLNRLVGTVLCSIQLMHFEGWKAAHMRHHKYANGEGDPHRVDRPLLPYIITHYFRIAQAVWQPTRFCIAISPPLILAGTVIAWQASVGHAARGVAWFALFWLIPTMASQALIAHFNYMTHVGLPPGWGRDTRSFSHGIWRLVNLLTCNFYLHAEHHRKPSQAIPSLQFCPTASAARRVVDSIEEPRS